MTVLTQSPFASVGVVGGGAWGTALAVVAAVKDRPVTLWAHETETVAAIAGRRENVSFLPGVKLSETIRPTTDLADLSACEAIVFVAPAQHARAVLSSLAPHLDEGTPLLLCCKGIEEGTFALMTDVAAEAAPHVSLGVLSGPSFAADVARGLPTAVTLAAADEAVGARWVATLGSTTFRPYLSKDMVGAELGGALKNVMAIACGIVEGKALGQSAKAALMARCFSEMQRLAAAFGAEPETLGGLSGLGDLILTCGSRQSRNMSLGAELGAGRALAEILGARNTVAEGVATARAVSRLAAARGVDMPVAAAVADIIEGRADVDTAIAALLSRPFKSERDDA